MQNVYAEQWEDFGKSTLEATKELESISASLISKLTEIQMQMLSLALEANVKNINLVSGTRDYKDLFTAHAKLASEYNEKLFGNAKKTSEILNEARTELTEWMSTVMKTSAKKSTNNSKAVKR
jgi:phasin family protein